MIVKKYNYPSLLQINDTIKKSRLYQTPDGESLPSVTTILSSTKDMTGLIEWRDRVGEEKANNILKESQSIGSKVHKYIENYILEKPQDEINNPYLKNLVKKVATSIISNGLSNVSEIWGIEVALYYPSLYAGQSDCIGVYKGKPAIIDFKNSEKIKDEKYVQDYYKQLCAYALAHNKMFGTDIKTGVVMMATRSSSNTGEFKEYVIENDKFDFYSHAWAVSLESFYRNRDKNK